jgi:hypothetical protein
MAMIVAASDKPENQDVPAGPLFRAKCLDSSTNF